MSTSVTIEVGKQGSGGGFDPLQVLSLLKQMRVVFGWQANYG
jgi:hypothetical protein